MAAKTVRRLDAARPVTDHIKRVVGDVELHVPSGCCATVLLKLVARDARYRYYAWWLTVGRYDLDTVAVSYRYTGEDTIRVDVPEGTSLCSDWMQKCLTTFLTREGFEPQPPPIVGPPPPPTEPK